MENENDKNNENGPRGHSAIYMTNENIGHRAYKCPNCGGEFDYWEPVLGGELGEYQCPFCGMKKGEYEKKKKQVKRHELRPEDIIGFP